MAHFWQGLRTGDWLNGERARNYSLILLAFYVAAIIGWVALSSGLIDRNGKPIGTDFSNVYAAGVLTWHGRAADAYDPPLQHAAEIGLFGNRDVPFFGWHYPPFFFVVAFLVAALPYAWGLSIWLIAGLAAYLATIRAILPRQETLLIAAAFPAVFVDVGHGQNGFLTASLLGGALYWLDRRPWLAGALIGLLAYKPQFGALIPLALVMGGKWRTIAAACVTIAAMVAVSLLTLGSGIWRAFAASTNFSETELLEQGAVGWEKLQSIFAAARMWGAGVHTAYAAQGALFLLLAATLAWLWRSDAVFELKAAALVTACLLATPYVLDYDLVALAIAITFFARDGLKRGFHDYEISVLVGAWLVPLLSRSIAGLASVPLGLIVMLMLYVVTLRRALLDREEIATAAHRIAQA